jgi:hypothetical protein
LTGGEQPFAIDGVVLDGERLRRTGLALDWCLQQLKHLPFLPTKGLWRRAVDLFCGIGGWTYALRLLGYEVLAGIDFNENVLEHYKANHPGTDAVCQDLTAVAESARLLDLYGQLQLLAMSPPCQPFSSASWSGAAGDVRRRLILIAAQIVCAQTRRVAHVLPHMPCPFVSTSSALAYFGSGGVELQEGTSVSRGQV